MGRVVLVTGVSRDLASRVALQLAERAATGSDIEKVVGIDVTPPPGDLGGVKFVRADIRTPVVGKVMAVEEVDTVLHMGLGPAMRGTAVRGGAKEINVIGSMQLLAACQRSPGVSKLIINSTAAVYGTSARDPAMFNESTASRAGTRSGFPKDAVEVESYVRGFSRRRPDVLITTLRMANILSSHVVSPFGLYFRSPILPSVIGYDPRLQFVHESDAINILREAVTEDRPGTFNVGGDGVMLLSQMARRLGKPLLPLPIFGFTGGLRRVLLALGTDVPPELARLLTYGRVIDTTALRDIFGYAMRHSTEQVFDEFAESVRPGVLSKLGGAR